MKLAKMRLLCSWDITHLPSMNCKMDDHKQQHIIYQKDKFQNKSRKSSGRTGTLITTNSQIKHNRRKQAIRHEMLTSLPSGNGTTGSSNKPTALRTFSSSANHSSCTLLTLLQIHRKYKYFSLR